MEERTDEVKKYYEANPKAEWDRTKRHQAEFALTVFMMDRYLKDGGSILDIGGGPGRYSINYALKGHQVTLVDLSNANIKYAKKKADYYKVKIEAKAADCLQLDSLGLGQYDDVFLMGPLYHLLKKEDRDEAIALALAHLKSGGHLFCSFIMNVGALLYDLKAGPGLIQSDISDEEARALIENIAKKESYQGKGFCPCVLFDHAEIEPLMKKHGMIKEAFFAQEGFIGPFEDKFNSLPKKERDIWISLAEKYIDIPEYGMLSEHMMFIGKKP